MRFMLATDLAGLAAYLPDFLALAETERWKKRAVQFARDVTESPFLAKIVTHYHWLELALSTQLTIYETVGHLVREEVDLRSLAALQFAGTVVEVHRRLSPVGQIALKGRIRDGLNADTGFAALHLEMQMAAFLLADGFSVEFPDLDGTGRYDIRFTKGETEGEVECKSLSTDGGRKIHRKDFYRFIDALGPGIGARAAGGANEVLLVTVEDRLPADTPKQTALRAAAERILTQPGLDSLAGEFFTITRESYSKHLGSAPLSSEQEFYRACQNAFGDNCHVSGAMNEAGVCLIVVRSRREDDHSKPHLEALKKAASQFSRTRPGFIAVQFDDIGATDLTLPHVRRRAALLSNSLFHQCETAHVAAAYYCGYGTMHLAPEGVGSPAFSCWNPRFSMPVDGLPFRAGLSNSEFARLLGVGPNATDPDDYIYGTDI